jgi:hypothetical protein
MSSEVYFKIRMHHFSGIVIFFLSSCASGRFTNLDQCLYQTLKLIMMRHSGQIFKKYQQENFLLLESGYSGYS